MQLLGGACAGQQFGRARDPIVVIDKNTRKPLSARILVRDAASRDFVPSSAIVVPIGKDLWFIAEGPQPLPESAGPFTIRVEHGTEYRAVKTLATQVELERWIDMRELGYTCGEDHFHVPAVPLISMLDAEGLDFGSSMQWWNGTKFNNPKGVHADRIFLNDAEAENSWGALYLIGMREPVSIPWDRKRSNLAFAKEARQQGALICYQGGWSREVLPDALLGYVDVVNLCNNNFHRYRFMPRRQYSNLLGIPGFPEYPNTAEGMMQMNTDTYYRLLNCGLRIAAGAGTATGYKLTPAGYNRTYVKAGPHPDIVQFREAWRGGRNFVTNGPMIFLTVNDAHEPGDTIALPKSGGRVRLRASALFEQPLHAVEIVANGEVVASGVSKAETSLDVKEGMWITSRATAQDHFLSDAELEEYRTESELGGEHPTRLRFGHTSPIYVTVGGSGARVMRSVTEARLILDSFEKFARDAASEEFRAEILEPLASARVKLG